MCDAIKWHSVVLIRWASNKLTSKINIISTMATQLGMDYLQEAIVLGIDALIFGVCLRGYYSYRNIIDALRVSKRWISFWLPYHRVPHNISFHFQCLFNPNDRCKPKDAPQLSLDSNLSQHVASHSHGKIPYVIIRGTVKPIGQPLQSIMTPSVTGVLQIIKVKWIRRFNYLKCLWMWLEIDVLIKFYL